MPRSPIERLKKIFCKLSGAMEQMRRAAGCKFDWSIHQFVNLGRVLAVKPRDARKTRKNSRS